MKITLKQLDYKCRRYVNPYMRRTRFGVSLYRSTGNDISVELVPRHTDSSASIRYTGAAREVDAFLSGLTLGLTLERVGEEADDGTDAY